jgi:hypothetical protein
MSDTIIDGTQFNVQNIKYTAPKVNGSQGKSVNILNKATNTGLRISTPLLLTWGASDFQDPATGKGNGKFEMSLQFPTSEYESEETAAFLRNMQDFEKKIKDDALTLSKEWFGKQHKNAEVVDALFTPMLKYSKDKLTGEPDLNKAPSLRVKIPSWEGQFRCEVYDEEGVKLFPNSENSLLTPIELIHKGTNVAALIQCGGIWFANGKFGITWKLAQLVVQKPRGTLTGQCFIKLNKSDKDKLKATQPTSLDVPVLEEDDVPLSSAADEEGEEEEFVTKPLPSVSAPLPTPDVSEAAPAVEEKKPVKKVVKKVVAK